MDGHFEFSRHAEARMSQRCIRQSDVALVLMEADWEEPGYEGAFRARLSREGAQKALSCGADRALLERVRGVVVVVADDGTVVTAYRRLTPGRRRSWRHRHERDRQSGWGRR